MSYDGIKYIYNLLRSWGQCLNPNTDKVFCTESLLAAKRAHITHLSRCLKLASLCHNIGYILEQEDEYSDMFPDMGAYRPYLIAGHWLDEVAEFPKSVSDPIRLLLPALRFWAAEKSPLFLRGLPQDLKKVLSEIGPPMGAAEAHAYKSHKHFEDAQLLLGCIVASKEGGNNGALWSLEDAFLAFGCEF